MRACVRACVCVRVWGVGGLINASENLLSKQKTVAAASEKSLLLFETPILWLGTGIMRICYNIGLVTIVIGCPNPSQSNEGKLSRTLLLQTFNANKKSPAKFSILYHT